MDVDVAILLGATPRAKDMEWDDQFKCNVRIFRSQGKALDTYAKKTVKVLVVGSPANTNCLIAMTSAPSIPPENFSCLTRLSQNRAQSRLGGWAETETASEVIRDSRIQSPDEEIALQKG
ncbi:hypothetical protein chiPu_0026189 [Chiloscyllium punctatum]|uniref:Malate dehydrogenase, cytoplasmic n=1 Tax=Chiloscyllium punctatum TaxID=137246 RepID=A0A401THR8_CHIPU|nr:hypothetical protein [Chiloscyllium punctatum]